MQKFGFSVDRKTLLMLAAAGVLLYIIKKGSVQNAVAGVTAGAVGAVDSVASGIVVGLGDVVGVPRTDLQRCKECITLGDNAGAAKYCTASVFARWQYLSARKRLTGESFTMSDILN